MPVNIANAEASPLAGEYIQRRYGVIAGGLHLLLPQGVSAELLHDQELTRILLAPPALRGVANVRGTLLPVFDLAKLIAAPASTDEQVLMLGNHPDALGLLVQGFPLPLSGLQTLTNAQVPTLLQPYLRSAWQQQEQHWFDIDLLQLFRDLAALKTHQE
ncbi:chemotaxis protein CheW [Chitinibacter bivalviorum]|uniref:Chemotaxis protein CheW n=1 Tax=Chitinibacter bivalviorum TaxID=2739434 RepID=A0A7H9BLF3_9NEIS|nr:chemotaxis protein CheW [Chitinibacter bivalviorum]QLG89108.1 chemotaxis protein CheW [Chitinibacter bivalviorum]